MESNLDDLQQKADTGGEVLVDNEKAGQQGLPSPARRAVRGQDWTSILRKANLEAPNYHETVKKMKEDRKPR